MSFLLTVQDTLLYEKVSSWSDIFTAQIADIFTEVRELLLIRFASFPLVSSLLHIISDLHLWTVLTFRPYMEVLQLNLKWSVLPLKHATLPANLLHQQQQQNLPWEQRGPLPDGSGWSCRTEWVDYSALLSHLTHPSLSVFPFQPFTRPYLCASLQVGERRRSAMINEWGPAQHVQRL